MIERHACGRHHNLKSRATQPCAGAPININFLPPHRNFPDLRDKKAFWQRKNSCVKAHMLLLAHLAREEVPEKLLKDQRFVLKKAPVLVEEIIKIAGIPKPPYGLGWLAPLLGGIEFMQHMVQVDRRPCAACRLLLGVLDQLGGFWVCVALLHTFSCSVIRVRPGPLRCLRMRARFVRPAPLGWAVQQCSSGPSSSPCMHWKCTGCRPRVSTLQWVGQ